MVLYNRIKNKILRETLKFILLVKSTRNYIRSYGLFFKKNLKLTYIEYNIGDNIIHLNYIKKLANLNKNYTFIHFMKDEYLNQINEFIIEQNIILLSLKLRPFWAINSWKNNNNYWLNHKHRNNFEYFYLDYFKKLSDKLKLENPIKNKNDLIINLTDIDKIKNYKSYEYFIVNSAPLSSQFDYDEKEINTLIHKLAKNNSVITTKKIDNISCTTDKNLTIYQIGLQSTKCKNHIMISTGPSWFALNSYNLHASNGIYLLLKEEKIQLSDKIKNFETTVDLLNYFLENKVID